MLSGRKRKLGYIMLIHAVAFGVVAALGRTHVAFPVMFLIAAAVLLRMSREEPGRKPHE
jgi:hypothetical protein